MITFNISGNTFDDLRQQVKKAFNLTEKNDMGEHVAQYIATVKQPHPKSTAVRIKAPKRGAAVKKLREALKLYASDVSILYNDKLRGGGRSIKVTPFLVADEIDYIRKYMLLNDWKIKIVVTPRRDIDYGFNRGNNMRIHCYPMH